MNTFDIISFNQFYEEYFDNLNPILCVHPAIHSMFMGLSITAYGQMITKMTYGNTAPLPLFFDNPMSMKDISKKGDFVKKIFEFLDVNKLGRIDAYEFLVPIFCVLEGKMDKYWDGIIDNFGVETKGKISKDEFNYLIDTMFRGFAKILVKKDEIPYDYHPKRYRIDYNDINQMVNDIFKVSFLDKNELKTNIQESCPNLGKLLEYIHSLASECLKTKSKDKVLKLEEEFNQTKKKETEMEGDK